MTDTATEHEGSLSTTESAGRTNVTHSEARAAARAKLVVDHKLGRTTEQWIVDLANS